MIKIAIVNFSGWVLDVDDGKVSTIVATEEEPTWIKISSNLLMKAEANGV